MENENKSKIIDPQINEILSRTLFSAAEMLNTGCRHPITAKHCLVILRGSPCQRRFMTFTQTKEFRNGERSCGLLLVRNSIDQTLK